MTTDRRAEITTEIASLDHSIMLERYKERGYSSANFNRLNARRRELLAELAD